MMAERPPGPVWEGDFDGALGPCWRQPLAALALVVSDIKDKAKGLDPVSPRPGVAQTGKRPRGEAQASTVRAAGEGEELAQEPRVAVRRPWVDYLRARVAGVSPSPSDQLVPAGESPPKEAPQSAPGTPRTRPADRLDAGMPLVPSVHVFQPAFDEATAAGERGPSGDAPARPRRRAGEFSRASDLASEAGSLRAGLSAERRRSRDGRRSSDMLRCSEDRGGSREARRRSSERRSSGARRRSSSGKLEKAGAKRDVVLRRRLALERAWRESGGAPNAAPGAEAGLAGPATDVEAEFSSSELEGRVRVFRGQTAPPGV